jgi:hypothetical protein
MIKIDYDKNLNDYNISLIKKLRGFGSSKSYLQFWVPDNDIVESILSLINSCKESKEYFVEIKVKKKIFSKKNYNKLKKILETMGHFHSAIKDENIYIRINIDQYKTQEHNIYKKFKTLKVQKKKIKTEKNNKLLKEVFIKKKYVKIIKSIDLSEVPFSFYNDKLFNNINTKVEKTLSHDSYFADFNLNINSNKEVVDFTWTLKDKFRNKNFFWLKKFLKIFKNILIGKSIFEIYEHSLIYLIDVINYKGSVYKSKFGIIFAENEGLIFHHLKVFLNYIKKNYQKNSINRYYPDINQDWSNIDHKKKVLIIRDKINEFFLKENINSIPIEVLDVQHDFKVVIKPSNNFLIQQKKNNFLLKLEEFLKYLVDFRIEIYTVEKKDENKLRQKNL